MDEFGSGLNVESMSNVVTREKATNNDDLLVKRTTLPGCRFDGLFASRRISKDEIICKYTGKILRTVEAMRLVEKSYLMRLGEQCYVDAREDLSCYARYINDCINPEGWNVRFEKVASEKCAYVVAIRDIAPDEELFADYGRWYWVKQKPVKL